MSLPDIIRSLSDAAGAVAPGPGDAIRALIRDYFKRRAEEARDILLEEIAKGETLPTDAAATDSAIGAIVRYLRAAQEGAARINLRLLAKALVGNMRVGTLVSDEFLLYAEALATLSRDEILVVAELYRAHLQISSRPFVRTTQGPGSQPWGVAALRLKEMGWDGDRPRAAATRALRSGLVVAASQSGLNASGQWVFSPSNMLLELAKTVDFEDAIRAEATAAAGT